MANREMGEIPVMLRGEEHVFCFDLNGVLALCEHFGVEGMDELDVMGTELTKPKHLRFVVAVALRGGSLPVCTEEQAGRLVPLGCLKVAIEGISSAFTAATKSLDAASTEVEEADPTDAGA